MRWVVIQTGLSSPEMSLGAFTKHCKYMLFILYTLTNNWLTTQEICYQPEKIHLCLLIFKKMFHVLFFKIIFEHSTA